MNSSEKQNYRETISKELNEKENGIDNSISYITVGLLAFFLTYNEKFINIIESNCRILMYLSIFTIIISFVFGLYDKFISVKYIKKLISFIDDNDLTIISKESELFAIWKKSETLLKWIKIATYVFLFLGLILEFSFISVNIEKKASIKSVKFNSIVVNINDTVVVNSKETFVVEKDSLRPIK